MQVSMSPQLRTILGSEQIWKSGIKYYGFPEFVWKHFYPTKDGNLSLNTMEFHSTFTRTQYYEEIRKNVLKYQEFPELVDSLEWHDRQVAIATLQYSSSSGSRLSTHRIHGCILCIQLATYRYVAIRHVDLFQKQPWELSVPSLHLQIFSLPCSNLLSTMSNELFSLNVKLMSVDEKQKKEIEFMVQILENISRSTNICSKM